MHASADLIRPLLRAALLRRALPWLAAIAPWLVCGLPAGALVMALLVVIDALLLLRRVRRDWTRWIDSALPEFEDSSALLVEASTPVARLQRARLQERVSGALAGGAARAIAHTRVAPGWRWPALSLVAAVAIWSIQSGAAHKTVAQLLAPPAARLQLHVTPPAYTGQAAFDSAPRELTVPEHSEVRWCLQGPQTQAAPIELSDGQKLALAPCVSWRASESVFWRWQGVRYNLRVTPDAAPQVSITVPKEINQTLERNATNAAMAITVSDDHAVVRASLHLTLARGNGENIRFSDREVPLPAAGDPRQRDWKKLWLLKELGMEPGDELYFFVRATDNAPQPHTTQSPTYTLRLPGPPPEEAASLALPTLVKPENLRSQRQIIIDTEQLVADLPRLTPAALRARSESIAADQGQLRRRYGQFLGEESNLFGDEHDDHGHDGKTDLVAEYGHVHDKAEAATLFDEATKKVLRRALSAMWEAEKALRAIAPRPALAPEYKALDAIKELQQADRIYLHRTAFVPPPIKEDKRMSGDVVGAASYRRAQGGAAEVVPAEVRALIQALAGDGALPALWSRQALDIFAARMPDADQRLAAQRAVQDVADGCLECRAALRAYLRATLLEAPVLLQATPVASTPFTEAWSKP